MGFLVKSPLAEEPQRRLMIGPPQQSTGTSPYFCCSTLRWLASIASVVAMNVTFPNFRHAKGRVAFLSKLDLASIFRAYEAVA